VKPLLKEELFCVIDAMGDGLKDARDRALLLIGFAGGFRRSELVGLDVSDVDRASVTKNHQFVDWSSFQPDGNFLGCHD
jgi:site-specific recombinase XerC